MNHLASLPGLLRTQVNLSKPLARQKLGNLLAALDSLYLLLAPISSASAHQVISTGDKVSRASSRRPDGRILCCLHCPGKLVDLDQEHTAWLIYCMCQILVDKLHAVCLVASSAMQQHQQLLQVQGSEQAQQQADKAGVQATLLQAGCLEALTHLIGSSSPALRSQVSFIEHAQKGCNLLCALSGGTVHLCVAHVFAGQRQMAQCIMLTVCSDIKAASCLNCSDHPLYKQSCIAVQYYLIVV